MKKRTASEAEERLRAAFACGEALDLRKGEPDLDDPSGGAGWTEERQVRAEVIAELVHGGHDQRISALSISGARIAGTLDLRHVQIMSPLIMKGCYFDDPVDLSEVRAPSACFAGSVFPSLSCYGLQVERDVDYSGIGCIFLTCITVAVSR